MLWVMTRAVILEVISGCHHGCHELDMLYLDMLLVCYLSIMPSSMYGSMLVPLVVP